MAVIEQASRTETSMKVYLDSLDTDYDNNLRTCKWYIMKNTLEGEALGYTFKGPPMTLANKIYASQTHEIIGLEPGTSYKVKAEITAEGWKTPVVLSDYFETAGSSSGPDDPDPDKPVDPEPPPEDKPGHFYWSDETLYALNNKGPTTTLTADEWNTFMKEIQKQYKNMDMSKVLAKSGDPITAAAFNYAASKVGGGISLTPVKPGQPCEGKLFIALQDDWNEWIDG